MVSDTKQPKVNQITKVVYFCGICNKIIGHDFFCKSCKHQFEVVNDE